MRFRNPYFTEMEKISLLQRWILVHSRLYYHYNYPIKTDQEYDMTCRQLVSLMKLNPKSRTRWSYVFDDFDGSTGMGLFEDLIESHKWIVETDCNMIIRARKAIPSTRFVKTGEGTHYVN